MLILPIFRIQKITLHNRTICNYTIISQLTDIYMIYLKCKSINVVKQVEKRKYLWYDFYNKSYKIFIV